MRLSISIMMCTQFQIKSHSLDKSVHIKNLNHQLDYCGPIIFAYLSKMKYTIFPSSISSSSLFLSKEGEERKAAVDFVS